MNVIAIFGDAANQRGLAAKIHDVVPLKHIARVRVQAKRRRNLLRSAASITIGRRMGLAWRGLQRSYDERYPDWPEAPSSIHPSANDKALRDLIERETPDLVLVSGTDLLKKSTLKQFGTKVMNLHTGISPYIRGGPNCTNWALALGEFDMIGSTVMWIDPGIDTGNIIASERTPLTGRENLLELHTSVMEHAHELYVRCIARAAAGFQLQSVRQKVLSPGRLFLDRDWTADRVVRATVNFRRRYSPEAVSHLRPIGLVGLEDVPAR